MGPQGEPAAPFFWKVPDPMMRPALTACLTLILTAAPALASPCGDRIDSVFKRVQSEMRQSIICTAPIALAELHPAPRLHPLIHTPAPAGSEVTEPRLMERLSRTGDPPLIKTTRRVPSPSRIAALRLRARMVIDLPRVSSTFGLLPV